MSPKPHSQKALVSSLWLVNCGSFHNLVFVDCNSIQCVTRRNPSPECIERGATSFISGDLDKANVAAMPADCFGLMTGEIIDGARSPSFSRTDFATTKPLHTPLFRHSTNEWIPGLYGALHVSGVTFANFLQRNMSSSVPGLCKPLGCRAIASNPFTLDHVVPMFFTNVDWSNTPVEARFHLHPPNADFVNEHTCGTRDTEVMTRKDHMACEGQNQILISDLDESLLPRSLDPPDALGAQGLPGRGVLLPLLFSGAGDKGAEVTLSIAPVDACTPVQVTCGSPDQF